jgi:hypothetical protein
VLTVGLDADIHELFRRVGDGVTAELDIRAVVAKSLADRRYCRSYTCSLGYHITVANIPRREEEENLLLHNYIPQGITQSMVLFLEFERGCRRCGAVQLYAQGQVSLVHKVKSDRRREGFCLYHADALLVEGEDGRIRVLLLVDRGCLVGRSVDHGEVIVRGSRGVLSGRHV